MKYNLPLSDLLKNTFSKYPLNHEIDSKNVKKFIHLADPSVKHICKKIIDNTDHISFEKFLSRLNSCINDFLLFFNIIKPIYIFIDIDYYKNYEYKSSFWIFTYIKQYILFKTNFKYDIFLINNTDNLKDNDIILFIDDCIYSGTQMSDTINNINNIKKLKLFFYILVPFISNIGKAKVIYYFNLKKNRRLFCKIFFPFNVYKPKIVSDILTFKEISLIEKYYIKLLSFSDKFLIYFDHKLADPISTITHFYLGIVPNQKNFNILKHLNIKDYTNFSYLLDIIPIIKKCNKYKFKIDLYSPKCPAPPYKKNFIYFINLYKKDINYYKSLSNFKNKSISNNSIFKYNTI